MEDKKKPAPRWWVKGTVGFWVEQVAVHVWAALPFLARLLVGAVLVDLCLEQSIREALEPILGSTAVSLLALSGLAAGGYACYRGVQGCIATVRVFKESLYLEEMELLDWHAKANSWAQEYELWLKDRAEARRHRKPFDTPPPPRPY